MRLKKPYIGITPIIDGGLEKNFQKNFDESEQIQSIIKLDVLIDDKKVKRAGGYFITFMPDATEIDIMQVEKCIKNGISINEMLEKDISLQQMAEIVTGDNNLMVLLADMSPMYKCDCCKEKFEKALKSLSSEEINEIFEEQEKIETVCQFCNKRYEVTKDDMNLD